MSDLTWIRQLEDRRGRRPLDHISEERFERFDRVVFTGNVADEDRINPNSYSLAEDGTLIGLFLKDVSRTIVGDFPFDQCRNLKYLYLIKIDLSSFEFLSNLTGLTSLDLSDNQISDISFLSNLMVLPNVKTAKE